MRLRQARRGCRDSSVEAPGVGRAVAFLDLGRATARRASRRPPRPGPRRRRAGRRSTAAAISRAVSTSTRVDAVRRRQRYRAGDQGYPRARLGSGGGDGEALPAPTSGWRCTRTGSIGSWVGPAVTTMCLPAKRRLSRSAQLDPAIVAGGSRQAAGAILAARHLAFVGLDHGDRRRLAQLRRHCARSPGAATCARSSPGRRPRACRSPAATWWRDRRRFPPPSSPAGRRSPGRRRTRSASRLSWIWPISASSLRSHRLVWTGFRPARRGVIGVTKCAPPSVSTQRDRMPRPCGAAGSARSAL